MKVSILQLLKKYDKLKYPSLSSLASCNACCTAGFGRLSDSVKLAAALSLWFSRWFCNVSHPHFGSNASSAAGSAAGCTATQDG